MEARSSITPDCLQAMFESARNAKDKGQAQWFTPPAWGQLLSRPLNRYRPVLVDFSCGNGQLLSAAARTRSTTLLGCDIQRAADLQSAGIDSFVPADVTRFYPLLRAAEFQFDCGVFNPPWDLHWYRERLDGLLESDCPAVLEAYLETDPRLGADTIDSTAATLMLALDRMSRMGEGLLIGNEATLQRLIFAGPHAALAGHIWAHLIVDGNICMEKVLPTCSRQKQERTNAGCKSAAREGDAGHCVGMPPADFKSAALFQTGIIWFARGHERGCQWEHTVASLAEATPLVKDLAKQRGRYRSGAEATDYLQCSDTADRWRAAAGEWERINPHAPQRAPQYHLWLDRWGYIRTQLSLFDRVTGRVSKEDAAKLFELNERQPMHLLARREQRQALERAVFASPWRVCPQLQQAVREAIDQYNAIRAPLYPLPKIQRLGFLDEHERVECVQDFGQSAADLQSADAGQRLPTENRQHMLFRAGHWYPVRSTTVLVRRTGRRMNVAGEYDDVEWNGQELAFFLTAEDGREYCFMEARLRDPKVMVSIIKPGLRKLLRKLQVTDVEPCPVDFTLQELTDHFHIPEVPDVASVFPAEYQQNLDTLAELETIVNAN